MRVPRAERWRTPAVNVLPVKNLRLTRPVTQMTVTSHVRRTAMKTGMALLTGLDFLSEIFTRTGRRLAKPLIHWRGLRLAKHPRKETESIRIELPILG